MRDKLRRHPLACAYATLLTVTCIHHAMPFAHGIVESTITERMVVVTNKLSVSSNPAHPRNEVEDARVNASEHASVAVHENVSAALGSQEGVLGWISDPNRRQIDTAYWRGVCRTLPMSARNADVFCRRCMRIWNNHSMIHAMSLSSGLNQDDTFELKENPTMTPGSSSIHKPDGLINENICACVSIHPCCLESENVIWIHNSMCIQSTSICTLWNRQAFCKSAHIPFSRLSPIEAVFYVLSAFGTIPGAACGACHNFAEPTPPIFKRSSN